MAAGLVQCRRRFRRARPRRVSSSSPTSTPTAISCPSRAAPRRLPTRARRSSSAGTTSPSRTATPSRRTVPRSRCHAEDRRRRRRLRPGDQRQRPAPQRRQALDGVPLFRRGTARLAQGLLPPGALQATSSTAARSRRTSRTRCRPPPLTRPPSFLTPEQQVEVGSAISERWAVDGRRRGHPLRRRTRRVPTGRCSPRPAARGGACRDRRQSRARRSPSIAGRRNRTSSVLSSTVPPVGVDEACRDADLGAGGWPMFSTVDRHQEEPARHRLRRAAADDDVGLLFRRAPRSPS